ncbi:PREDICTED: uncharacterized protein LOC104745469 [Camelina sativa]|uniref:Uncharacterized protein LOC104745469 n=1 Tax=Camelina sativa TaxID=90675 RepID=A0ABM0W352_CAMSA|nr:PREDICTED: uncharacterized protein LOC104745469 [Camelina sativa]
MGGDRDAKRQKTTETAKVEEKVEKTTEMDKVDNNNKEETAGSVNFEELRDDLFREAAKLVSEDPSTKIAIFFTPPSSSDGSMCSFGYPSVDGVVKTFLADSDPAKNEEDEDEDDAEEEEDDAVEEEDGSSKGFWWEEGMKRIHSMNAEELQASYDRLSRLRDRMVLQLDDEAKLKLAHDSGNQQEEDLLLPNDKDAQPKPKP